jgi:hypothetical protein
MLYTNLNHIETANEFSGFIGNYEYVVLICGRMESSCVPAYLAAENWQNKFPLVKFFDMESDNPESAILLNLPEISHAKGIPIMALFKNGILIHSLSGIMSLKQFEEKLTMEFLAKTAS